MADDSRSVSGSDGGSRILAHAAADAVVDAPIEMVDLADWVMTLTDEEYRACAPGEHKGCGISNTDGRLTSICTEEVGGQLMVQHYVAQTSSPRDCRFVSLTDSRSANGWSTVDVTWTLHVKRLDDGRCTLTNEITSAATDEFAAALERAGISIADAGRQRLAGIVDHNRRETPAFAASIARHAAKRAAQQTSAKES